MSHRGLYSFGDCFLWDIAQQLGGAATLKLASAGTGKFHCKSLSNCFEALSCELIAKLRAMSIVMFQHVDGDSVARSDGKVA